MKFGRLAILNFLTIGEAGINLSDRGLLGVQGENEDDTSSTSNGAGKSTLGDALSWAIYGDTARGASGDSVVNDVAGKDCMVTVNVFDGDDSYIITRYRKHSTYKNGLIVLHRNGAGVDKNLTQGTEKLTQAVIDKIIGCSYEVFTAAIYAGQEKMPDLPSLTDKNLKVLVEEAAGTTVLDAAYEEAKKRFNSASARDAAAVNDVAKAVDSLTAAEDMLAEVERSRAGWDAERDKGVDEKRALAITHIAEVRSIQAAINVNKPTYEVELAECNAKLAAVEAEVNTERVYHDRLVETRRAEDKKIVAAQRAEDAALAEAKQLKGTTEKILHHLKHIDGLVGTHCGECDKVYSTEDLDDAAKLARTNAKTERAKFDTAKARYESAKAVTTSAKEAAEKALQSAQSTLEAHRRSMTDVSATSARVSVLNGALRDIAALESKATTLAAAAKIIMAEVKNIAARVNPYIERKTEVSKRVEAAHKGLSEAKDRKDAAVEEMALADTVAKVFSPAGVRAHILDTVTPFLNDRTAHYLGTLSDGNITAAWSTLTRTAKGELREKFKIDVQNAKGGKEFALISGGEKRKVRLACALALQDLVAQRASKPIDLFIGDEIDDALDDAGLERLMAVLEEKARERGTVIIISHRSLRDWIRECVTVTKRGGQSVVSEAV